MCSEWLVATYWKAQKEHLTYRPALRVSVTGRKRASPSWPSLVPEGPVRRGNGSQLSEPIGCVCNVLVFFHQYLPRRLTLLPPCSSACGILPTPQVQLQHPSLLKALVISHLLPYLTGGKPLTASPQSLDCAMWRSALHSVVIVLSAGCPCSFLHPPKAQLCAL